MTLLLGSLRGRGVLWAFLALSLTGWGQMNEVTRDQRLADVAHLDSALGPRMAEFAGREVGLGARNRLVSQMLLEGSVNELDWALALQGWLASAADAHLRLGFERMTTGRTDQPAPSCAELLEGWADFGPGPVVPLSAQCVWLEQTWPWVGALQPNPREVENEAPSMSTEDMSVVDHGAFLRWVVPSFGQASDRSFAQDFRRSRRKLRRAAKPVMLDLRGNLGGYRTRRHAVLQAFLATELWPEEREGSWSMAGAFEAVPVMPVVRTKRPLGVPVAVMLDGGSFSASSSWLTHCCFRGGHACLDVRPWDCEGAVLARRSPRSCPGQACGCPFQPCRRSWGHWDHSRLICLAMRTATQLVQHGRRP